jgi:hypothetical protein
MLANMFVPWDSTTTLLSLYGREALHGFFLFCTRQRRLIMTYGISVCCWRPSYSRLGRPWRRLADRRRCGDHVV